MNAPKSIFETTTGKSSILVFFAALVTIVTPHYSEYLKRHTALDHRDIDSAAKLTLEIIGLITFGGSYAGLVGAASTKSILYTPPYMSGFNKEDLTNDATTVKEVTE